MITAQAHQLAIKELIRIIAQKDRELEEFRHQTRHIKLTLKHSTPRFDPAEFERQRCQGCFENLCVDGKFESSQVAASFWEYLSSMSQECQVASMQSVARGFSMDLLAESQEVVTVEEDILTSQPSNQEEPTINTTSSQLESQQDSSSQQSLAASTQFSLQTVIEDTPATQSTETTATTATTNTKSEDTAKKPKKKRKLY